MIKGFSSFLLLEEGGSLFPPPVNVKRYRRKERILFLHLSMQEDFFRAYLLSSLHALLHFTPLRCSKEKRTLDTWLKGKLSLPLFLYLFVREVFFGAWSEEGREASTLFSPPLHNSSSPSYTLSSRHLFLALLTQKRE